ncbi:MAG: LysR family transcriptional regulator [Proteobacteria bacterium]|nr:LysR family transcriptional regulator [Pseudomonadota bacterium]MDA1357068.1 LysR family transcriptional regulator [Pseudomonadota bacterium]
MDRFREISTFVAAAESGAFNAAARKLNMSPAAVTRLVNSLEARIGARLFTRTTRKVALTEAGQLFLSDATRILEEVEEAEASAAGAHQSPRGVLRVTGPMMFGHLYVAPILRDYLDDYPAVSAFTLFVDRIVHLVEEGLDVAVRIGELPDSSLSAVRVGEVRRMMVAAPSYLAKHGAPETLDALTEHKIIHPLPLNRSPEWPFVSGGKIQTVKINPTLTVNTMPASIDAALAGWGITRVYSYQVARALIEGTLVEILHKADEHRVPIHLVHPEGRRAPAKTRAFVSLATKRLRADADLFIGNTGQT